MIADSVSGWHPDPQQGADYVKLLEDELDSCRSEIARLRSERDAFKDALGVVVREGIRDIIREGL